MVHGMSNFLGNEVLRKELFDFKCGVHLLVTHFFCLGLAAARRHVRVNGCPYRTRFYTLYRSESFHGRVL